MLENQHITDRYTLIMILETDSVHRLSEEISTISPSLGEGLAGVNLYIYGSILTVVLTLILFLWLVLNYKNKSYWKPYQESFSRRTLHNTIFISSSIFWASAVSVFGSKLQNQWVDNDNIGYESLVFFVSVAVAFLLGTRAYLSGLRKEENDKIEPSIDTVEIASASSISVQENYEGCLEDWILAYNDFENVPVEELKVLEKSIISSIKFCMKQMLEVLHSWTKDSGAVIKVNLLNVLDSASLLEVLERNQSDKGVSPSTLKNSPFFLFNDNWQSCLQRCDKVLINEQDLTQIIGSCETPRAHAPICMPYSINDTNDNDEPMQPNLIGAPEALKTGSIKYVTPLQERINEFLQEKIKGGSFFSEHATQNFQTGLSKYYDTDTAASIISIPLIYIEPKVIFDEEAPSSQAQETKPQIEEREVEFASVLNIYAHSNYILVNQDVVQSYCQLTKPIWHTLTKLVSMRLQLLSDIEAKVNAENRPYSKDEGLFRKMSRMISVGG